VLDILNSNHEFKQRAKIENCQKNKQQPTTPDAIQIFDFRDRRDSHSSPLKNSENYHRLKKLNSVASKALGSSVDYNIVTGTKSVSR
jgi:hypothetical protein